MNIRTSTDIDHAIAEACDLHDLRAGQTGTIRAPRQPTYDQPVDQPVVELTAEEEGRGIPEMEARRLRLLALVNAATGENEATIEAAF